jgi:carboxypeptidase C (cathepsin A)
MNNRRLAALALAVVLAPLAGLSLAPARAEETKPDAKEEKADKDKAPPKPAVSHGKVAIDGRTIAYTTTAATIDLKNDDGDLTGHMFYVAYLQDGVSDPTRRPVTFLFNGGPGSSTMWLHMASFGPVRVDVGDAEPTPPPPYSIVDNADSLLDKSDLVFVDAMSTGWSRIAGKGEPKTFYGVDADVAAFGQFVQRWVSANGRWNSPKFLLGESYGTTRAAGMLDWLQDRGMAFNGTILVSSYLNAFDDFNGPAFSSDLGYVLYLPTMAATAFYHDRVQPKPASLEGFVQEARAFALGEYSRALAQGAKLSAAERDAVVAKLVRFTAMPEAAIRNANLRIDPGRFQKELLRGERRTVGRLDARFEGIDHDAAGEYPESDAANAAFMAAVVASFNAYAHDRLGYVTDELYRPNAYRLIGGDWDFRHRGPNGNAPMPDVAEDLRSAMSANPHLKIFSANGYYDFATPFFETEYTMSHMGLDPALEKNITYGFYPAGHMMYIHPPARKQLKQDLAKFYDAATAR